MVPQGHKMRCFVENSAQFGVFARLPHASGKVDADRAAASPLLRPINRGAPNERTRPDFHSDDQKRIRAFTP
jgi:hypothetical protein